MNNRDERSFRRQGFESTLFLAMLMIKWNNNIFGGSFYSEFGHSMIDGHLDVIHIKELFLGEYQILNTYNRSDSNLISCIVLYLFSWKSIFIQCIFHKKPHHVIAASVIISQISDGCLLMKIMIIILKINSMMMITQIAMMPQIVEPIVLVKIPHISLSQQTLEIL